jgi:hypothetical protein
MTSKTPLLKVLSKLLDCNESALQERLNHPLNIQKVNDFLQGKELQTCYMDNLGEYREINGSRCRIGTKSSREQHAYEGYLGITVEVN